MQKQAPHLAHLDAWRGRLASRLTVLRAALRGASGEGEAARGASPQLARFADLVSPERFSALVSRGEGGVLVAFHFDDYPQLKQFDCEAAELALAAVGSRLISCLGKATPVAALDAPVFVTWLAGQDEAQARACIGAVEYALTQELTVGTFRLTPAVSIGATHEATGAAPAQMIDHALAARTDYAKGAVPFYQAENQHASKRRYLIEQEVRWAVEREQFSLLLQPVIDAETRRVLGAEALLRWRHREMGEVSPALFVPVLEKAGLMEALTQWVLTSACRQLRAWRDLGHGDLILSVNISAANLSPNLAGMVERQLRCYDVAPQSLEIELTETAAFQDVRATHTVIDALRSMGVSVAIDDFGIGYSSLLTLRDLASSKLKIDREFVSRVHCDRKNQACCEALIGLARGMDLKLVAEGVECAEEVQTLVALGCQAFQGFYFSAPLSAADFVDLVEARRLPADASASQFKRVTCR
jgi:EAL domain-containing protein (putative c-di-GMP-specific phosphodiesterase class I)